MSSTIYLNSVKLQFEYYKSLGEKTFNQLNDNDLFWRFNEESNSIATIINHLCGNMLSRWTDFLTIDGEKEWRQRDTEFENDITSRKEMLEKWNKGWHCLFAAINSLQTEEELIQIVFIRNEGHTIIDAINRQLAHYAYHVGQIVLIGKMLVNDKWQSLSVPKGKSQAYNLIKFAQPKQNKHFTDEYLKKDEK